MDSDIIWIFLIVGILGTVGLALNPIDSAIPPTPAFTKVVSGGQTINATGYNSNVTIAGLGDITTSISGNTLSLKLVEKTCPVGQSFNSIASNGTLICN